MNTGASVGADRAQRRSLAFDVAGDGVVGDLYLPAHSAAAARPFPAVVVAGPMTSVKEQVVGTYARALAERGIAALAIDHRHFGQSGGVPRQYEHHGRKIEDLRAAVTALCADPAVDAARIGAVGVCLGAGYAAAATAEDSRLRALAMVAGYYRDPRAIRARDPRAFDAGIAEGREARAHYETTGELRLVPAAALSADAAMRTQDTFDYYTRRAAVPNYRNAFAVMSREHFLPFDVQATATRLRVPTLMLHSEQALSPDWARAFHAAMTAPKQLRWIASRGQTDIYDDPAIVAGACEAVAAHLHAALG